MDNFHRTIENITSTMTKLPRDLVVVIIDKLGFSEASPRLGEMGGNSTLLKA